MVLPYIVERKRADDLANSIIDGRYKDQKYRLAECGASHIFYLFEGSLSLGCSRYQKQVDTALLKTRVRDGFKVVTVKDLNQSL